MRWILIALVAASAAWAQECTNWEITTFGMDDGFGVMYQRDWYYVVEGPFALETGPREILWILDGETYNYVVKTEHYEFHVDSLADIRPTPEEMEGRP